MPHFEVAPRLGVVSLPLLDEVLPTTPDGGLLAPQGALLAHLAAAEEVEVEAKDPIEGDLVHPGAVTGEATLPAATSWKDWFLLL